MTKKKPRVGLFGGTFNPVHFGHLNLAIEIQERCALEEVWWIPAALSPLKGDEPPVEGFHRLDMLKLATTPLPTSKVLDIEIKRPGPSYTIDTLAQICDKEGEYALILGEDALLDFAAWKNVDALVKKTPLLIGCRFGAALKEKIDSLSLSSTVKEAILKGIIDTTHMEISATSIRKRLRQNLYCGHLVPAKVLDYIYENQLYSSI